MTVPTADVRRLFGTRHWVGSDEARRWLGAGTAGLFVPRGPAEKDPSKKQVIPYVVLGAEGKVYSYARGKAGAEARLHARRSIGSGGHINPCDVGETLVATIRHAAGRELHEELGVVNMAAFRGDKFIGLVNDDSDDVGRVHVGVCFLAELYTADVEPREAAISDGRWCTIEELRADRDRYESWSQIVIDMNGGG
jgi:predicted NUDIX family phosphoesterase